MERPVNSLQCKGPRVVYFQSNSYGILDAFKGPQFGWTNTTV